MSDDRNETAAAGKVRPKKCDLSVIIPFYNEEENVRPLLDELKTVLAGLDRTFEVICVDDGSIDGTPGILSEISAADPSTTCVQFSRNFGQTAAIMAGLDRARGETIVLMDGDMQNDPADIPMLLAEIDKGMSVVSGWRRDRNDAFFSRVLPSRIANWLIRKVSGVQIHDLGCTLKAYRSAALKNVRLYGEMHRLIAIYASWYGVKTSEVEVNHRARQFGRSKYGLSRTFKVLLDLLVAQFLMGYTTKPIYLFGGIGIGCIGISFLTALFAIYLRLFESVYLIQTPLLLIGVMFMLVGVVFLFMGLLAELLIRIYFESQNKPIYVLQPGNDGDS
jgi:dolichol-phosphate mannosyltransferase